MTGVIRKYSQSAWLRWLLVGLFVLGYSHQLVAQFVHPHHHGVVESSTCPHGHDHDHGDEDDTEGEDPEKDGDDRCCASCTPSASEAIEPFGLGQFAELVSLSVQTFSAREYLVVDAVYHPPRLVS